MGNLSVSKLFLVYLFVAVVVIGYVNSIKCYQCGLYTTFGSSVTPCPNLTHDKLSDCPSNSTHCTKHVGPAINVYGCEVGCTQRTVGSFETFCCNENACNGVSSLFESRARTWTVLIVPVLFATFVSLGGCLQSLSSTLFHHLV